MSVSLQFTANFKKLQQEITYFEYSPQNTSIMLLKKLCYLKAKRTYEYQEKKIRVPGNNKTLLLSTFILKCQNCC